MTVEAPGRDVVAVQMLRGIAATMVVFVHLDTELARLHYPKLQSYWMATGVDIFFVISGFIMWTSVERRQGLSAGAFLRNRIIRIVPLYWLVTTVVLFVGLATPQLLKTTVVRPAHALASYLFLPARHPVTGTFWPLAIPGWSLNYEMLFYLIFALAIAFAGPSRALRLVLIVGLLSLVLLVADLTKGSIDVMNFYANPVLLEFVAGVVVGILWRSGFVPRSRGWFSSVLGGFVLLWVGTHFGGGFVTTMVAATMIVGGAVFAPPLAPNPLSSLGDASYSLYLTHTITLSAVALVWQQLFSRFDWWLYAIISLVLAIAVSIIIYTCFEAPMTSGLKRIKLRPNPAVQPVPDPDSAT